MRSLLLIILFSSLLKVGLSQSSGMGLSFIPDYKFKGSGLTGWKPFGAAKWTAQNGEIKAVLPSATDAGLLIMNKSFQDVGVHLLFKCGSNSEAGVLVRLEKTKDSIKAILISVKDGEFGSYRVALDQQGKIIQRDKLRT